MTLERRLAVLFGLNDATWLRHANPASVWSRYSVLPLLVLGVWSRTWLGWWCLVPLTVSLVWMFANPLVFGKPVSTRNWASRAVLGERIYLNRDKVEIPAHHRVPLYRILHAVSSAGLALALGSAAVYSFWGAVCGILLTYLGKSWFLDRMVWLYEDMKDVHAEYAKWDY